ncbi:MAG: hypothetical protein QM597_06980 [Aeromicrobium sp.]|uniref:hypothetical protein n=1 Tax=Aeromicrobium sp. TaxID=1871063 RepID=UPI0039E46150
MVGDPITLPSAFRHGMGEEDMLHAVEFALYPVVQEDGMVMWIGPNLAGSVIEVGVIEWHGELAIAHAMNPARDKYLR